jgi:very-short-patch-repair endonuclease
MKLRNQLLKIQKRNSTKPERKIMEILKENHIPFRAKWKVNGKEVDFLVGRVILEIDGKIHKHIDTEREKMLFDAGYIPIHISSREIYEDKAIEEKIIGLIKQ